jgi:hypothetical protein
MAHDVVGQQSLIWSLSTREHDFDFYANDVPAIQEHQQYTPYPFHASFASRVGKQMQASQLASLVCNIHN